MDVRAMFPLTLKYLGSAGPPVETADAFVRAICELHARGDIPSRAVRDLVRYEAALAGLPPTHAGSNGPFPADDEPIRLAPHVHMLVYGAALPEMLAGLRADGAAKPRPCRGWIIAWRDGSGEVRELILPRMEGWLLETFREAAPPSEAIEDDEDRERLHSFWRDGILARAK